MLNSYRWNVTPCCTFDINLRGARLLAVRAGILLKWFRQRVSSNTYMIILLINDIHSAVKT